MSPKEINLCPVPSEEIQQSVINPEVMGETAIIPEVIFVKIVILPPPHLGLILTQSDHSSEDA